MPTPSGLPYSVLAERLSHSLVIQEGRFVRNSNFAHEFRNAGPQVPGRQVRCQRPAVGQGDFLQMTCAHPGPPCTACAVSVSAVIQCAARARRGI